MQALYNMGIGLILYRVPHMHWKWPMKYGPCMLSHPLLMFSMAFNENHQGCQSLNQHHVLMTHIAREFNKHPDHTLHDKSKVRVKKIYVFDMSKSEVRKWWLNICLNATKYANGDGCFCDSSQRVNVTFTPRLSASKEIALSEGLVHKVQEGLHWVTIKLPVNPMCADWIL